MVRATRRTSLWALVRSRLLQPSLHGPPRGAKAPFDGGAKVTKTQAVPSARHRGFRTSVRTRRTEAWEPTTRRGAA